MLKRLEKIEKRYIELENQISQPKVASDPKQLQALAQERAGLEDIVSRYRQYKDTARTLGKTKAMLVEEIDEDMKSLVTQEIESLESQMNRDEKGAYSVMQDDDAVDRAYYELVDKVKAEIAAGPGGAEELIGWIMVAKHIERVADLATNIAEDTVYMIKGDIIRHGQGWPL